MAMGQSVSHIEMFAETPETVNKIDHICLLLKVSYGAYFWSQEAARSTLPGAA
jgi:hypothetical protein